MESKHHIVEKRFRPGMRIKEAVQQTGEVNIDVIIVHAATNNITSRAQQEFAKVQWIYLEKFRIILMLRLHFLLFFKEKILKSVMPR